MHANLSLLLEGILHLINNDNNRTKGIEHSIADIFNTIKTKIDVEIEQYISKTHITTNDMANIPTEHPQNSNPKRDKQYSIYCI